MVQPVAQSHLTEAVECIMYVGYVVNIILVM